MKKGKTNVQHASNLYSAPRRRRLPRRALGLRGNWKAESGLEPCRLQNDFSANRIYSHAYTADLQATEEAPSDPNSTLHSALSTLYYPYRMIDKSMAGTDVAVLQAILTARGYYTGPLDGLFGDTLDAAARRFQSDHDLDPDGVVGPLSWRKILSLED